MKILFISYCDPVDNKTGDSIYTFDILNNLKNIKAEISFLSYSVEQPNENHLNILNRYCEDITFVPFKPKSKLRLVASIYPASIKNRKNSNIISSVQGKLQNDTFDFVVVNHFKMSFIIEYIKKWNLTTVFIAHNEETYLSKSLFRYSKNLIKYILFYQEHLKTKYYELKYLEEFDVITAISDFDVNRFKYRFPDKKIILLPPLVINKNIPFNMEQVSNKVIFCGTFFWEPKRENLMRLLKAKNFNKLLENQIKLLIVGNAPRPFVKEINQNFKGVEMTGYVSDTKKYYLDSKIALVPELLGGGFKLKIAEAISFNRPIIALKQSISDFEMKHDVHYIKSNSFEDMINATIELIKDNRKMKMLSDNAMELFEKKYSKAALQLSLCDVFLNKNDDE